ncbi:hypothetical protein HYE59_07075 [Aggregatibacter actinomycetemcomitans]|uniref:hypothetical protein n=1 Tax=Aggregatibacter actinomycetemcomitans TaxID=714 RepID=UPI00197B5235|nr:hypothetical protein [Aggregatibacter actinomycetemcomitans]MBN6077298.1 hypothetical protein [Aggregatibacter actinomycetemcomitans]
MSHVKITFTVEVDGETIVQHQIEEENMKKDFYFSQERELTKEIIDKMNKFHYARLIDAKPWSFPPKAYDRP